MVITLGNDDNKAKITLENKQGGAPVSLLNQILTRKNPFILKSFNPLIEAFIYNNDTNSRLAANICILEDCANIVGCNKGLKLLLV